MSFARCPAGVNVRDQGFFEHSILLQSVQPRHGFQASQAASASPSSVMRCNSRFYLPFYRVMDEDTTFSGPRVGDTGLVRQRAYKKLKGGTKQLDDLLGNAMLNWNHIISASLNNQAARKALETAEEMGLATQVTARDKSKKAVFVRIDGKEQWYDLENLHYI